MFFVGLYTSQKYPISRSIQHQIEHFDVKWFTYHIRATHNNFQSHSCIIKFPRSSRRRDGAESRRPLSSAMILHVPHENFTRFFIFKLKTLVKKFPGGLKEHPHVRIIKFTWLGNENMPVWSYIIDFVAQKVISYRESDSSGDFRPKKCSTATMERDFSISPLFHF